MATLDQLETALRNADAAGDTQAARMLASEVVKMRGAQKLDAPEDKQDIFGGPLDENTLGAMTGGVNPRDIPRHLDNTARMLANGATFGLADKFAGGMNYLTGNAPSYDEGVKAERERTQAVHDETPVAAKTAEIAGGLGTGWGLAKSGITLAGRVGPSLLSRMLGFGAEGAAYGAVHGAGNTYSDNPMDYLANAAEGAKWGFGFGVALPAAGSLSKGAYDAGLALLAPRVEGLSRTASALLNLAAKSDGLAANSLSRLGPDAMLPDAGPSMLGLAQGAATGSGSGRSAIVSALQGRDAATSQRLGASLDAHLGSAPIPSQVEAQIAGDLKNTGALYDQPMNSGSRVNTQPIADHLDALYGQLRGPAQKAVQSVRQYLNLPGTNHLDPSPSGLFQTRQAIDGLLSNETNPQVVRQLTIARQAIDQELASAVPGIKDVDARYAELMRQKDALTRGSQIIDNGKNAIRPQELSAEIQQGAIPEGELTGPSASPLRLKQGARAEIDRLVGTHVNDLNTLERTFATPQDWNYQKLGLVFGNSARDRVAESIAANRQFRDTFQKVAQGSQTAQRTKMSNVFDETSSNLVPKDTTLTGLGLNATQRIVRLLAGMSKEETRDQLGQILSRQGEGAERVLRALLDSAGRNKVNVRDLIASPQTLAAFAPVYDRK
jgi:hypothetical protein